MKLCLFARKHNSCSLITKDSPEMGSATYQDARLAAFFDV